MIAFPKIAYTYQWSDGSSLDLDYNFQPIGYKWLGDLRDLAHRPSAPDWERYHQSSDGNKDWYYSASLRMAYSWDSSD